MYHKKKNDKFMGGGGGVGYFAIGPAYCEPLLPWALVTT
jgi:hypothetical protein